MKSLHINNPIDYDLKVVKDIDNTSSALELSKTKVRVKDLEVTGSTEGITFPVDNNIKQIFCTGFYGDSSKMYIPLNGYIYERTSTSYYNEYIAFVTPYDGYLDQVVCRSEAICGNTIVGLHKSSTGTEFPNAVASNSVTISMATDDTPYKFEFGTSASFNAGDILAISFDPLYSSYDTNISVVFSFDSGTSI